MKLLSQSFRSLWLRLRPVLRLGASVGVVGILTQCTSPPQAPGDVEFRRGAERQSYSQAYHLGQQDGRAGLPESYERHYRVYNRKTEATFQTGYQRGFESGRKEATPTEQTQLDAYQQGYDAAQSDAANGQRPLPQRHRATYTPRTEQDFQRGYQEGYHAARSPERSE